VQLLEKPFTRTELAHHVQRALAHVPGTIPAKIDIKN
jgi:hypothetical protein